jgi:hypothetical protein
VLFRTVFSNLWLYWINNELQWEARFGMDRIDAGNRREPGGPGGRRSGTWMLCIGYGPWPLWFFLWCPGLFLVFVLYRFCMFLAFWIFSCIWLVCCIFRKYFGKVTFWYTLCFLYFSGVFTNYGALVFSSIWTVCFSYFSGSVFCIFLACFWYFF